MLLQASSSREGWFIGDDTISWVEDHELEYAQEWDGTISAPSSRQSNANSTSINPCPKCSCLKTLRSSWPFMHFLLSGGSPTSPVHFGALFAIESTKIALLQRVQTNNALFMSFPSVGVSGKLRLPKISMTNIDQRAWRKRSRSGLDIIHLNYVGPWLEIFTNRTWSSQWDARK